MAEQRARAAQAAKRLKEKEDERKRSSKGKPPRKDNDDWMKEYEV